MEGFIHCRRWKTNCNDVGTVAGGMALQVQANPHWAPQAPPIAPADALHKEPH